jgi:hypothetical protein
MSRFRSESRFMDPHDPAKSQARPILPFFVVNNTVDGSLQEAKGHGFYFALDHEDALLGHTNISRFGAYRRGFRKSGPEIGEGKNVNG